MILSYQKNFLFIHVPKTAGTSIRAALMPYSERPDLLWENKLLSRIGINVNHIGPYRRRRFRGHSRAMDLQKNLPASVYDGLFKFAFVRNPWDLLVSLYSYIPSRPRHRMASRVAAMTFDEFAREWSQRPELSQRSFLYDTDGRCLMNYVGHFETLRSDFEDVCRHIGITADLGHANGSRRGDYREMYSPELMRLVGDRLADDIETFGYDFDEGVKSRGSVRRAA